jgi:hypothetical protein
MFNPDMVPLSQAMITGELTEKEMEREHPEDLRDIEAAENEVRPPGAGRPEGLRQPRAVDP